MNDQAKLQEFCTITQGGKLKLSGNDFVEKGYPAYGAGGLNGYLPVSEFDRPAIVLSSIGARCGKCFYVDGEWTSLANTQLIFPDLSKAFPMFLWYQLNDEKRWPRAGTGQPFIKPSDVKKHKVFLPSLSEQRRIASILDRADALRAKRRAAIAHLDELTQAIFIDMFGCHRQSPVTIGDRLEPTNEGWNWELLTEVGRLATGHTPDRKRSEYWNGNIPWITLTDIRRLDGTIAQETGECVTAAGIDNSSAVKLPVGTVCFSRTASVGFVTVMGKEMATSQDFVNWVCGPRVDPVYLMHAFLLSRDRLRALSTGSTHKTIYFPTVERFRALIPPMDLQKKFRNSVEKITSLKAMHHAALVHYDNLFSSLQDRAFRGEL